MKKYLSNQKKALPLHPLSAFLGGIHNRSLNNFHKLRSTSQYIFIGKTRKTKSIEYLCFLKIQILPRVKEIKKKQTDKEEFDPGSG